VPATVIIASLSGSAFGIPAILMRGRHLRPRHGIRAGAAIMAITLVLLWVVQWLTGPSASVPVPRLSHFAVAATAGGLIGLLVTVRLAARRYPIPFGPFLALGAVVCLFLEPQSLLWRIP
jgi:hypothetical protein